MLMEKNAMNTNYKKMFLIDSFRKQTLFCEENPIFVYLDFA